MNLYGFLYCFSIIFSIFLGYTIWHRYRNISGLFFFLFTLFASTWYFLYFLFFSGIDNPTLLLYITRFAFSVGLISAYSLLFFIIFFQKKNQKITGKNIIQIVSSGIGMMLFFTFSPHIISDIIFSESDGVYREKYGKLFFIVPILYFNFVVLFFYFAKKRIREYRGLDRIRIRNIVIATYTGIFSLLGLQLFLPLFGIWILEKEIIFCFLFFIAFSFFTITRYYFSSVGYGISRIVIFFTSFALAYYSIQFIDTSMQGVQMGMMNNYWKVNESAQFIIKSFLGLILYIGIEKNLSKYFLGNTGEGSIRQKIYLLKKTISTITQFHELEKVLQKELHNVFKTSTTSIVFYNQQGKYQEIRRFFESPYNSILINDYVFIEEQKIKYDTDKLRGELSKSDFLILPLHTTDGKGMGILKIGIKPFGDFYTKNEIDLLKEFSFFLEIHLKYIRTYSTLQDFSLNLDKKVDEKTIEYNDLINKQKEFIGVISHEIKSPIASAIFQSDSLIDDLDDGNLDPTKLREELSILNTQLVRTGGLLSKLFSVQYYDTHAVHLFREKIEFSLFLENEIELFSHIHPEITFLSQIDKSIGFIEIDKIQFQQVINNLLDNAVKFLHGQSKIISLSTLKKEETLEICIEDNGKGFEGIEIKDIFDKYTTGNKGTVGLGMGLYLCRKIITMHGGTIEAKISENYGGACFQINLPIRH